MKKGILISVAVLALVGVMIAPMAALADGTTTISGSLTACSIEVAAPTSFAFATFVVGSNHASSPNDGTVNFTPGTTGTSWQLTAQDTTSLYPGYMYCSAGSGSWLTDKLWIGLSDDGYRSNSGYADTAVSISGDGAVSEYFTLSADQTIESSDTPGDYSITITLTGSQSL